MPAAEEKSKKTFGQRPELPGPSWATQVSKRGKGLLSSFQLRKYIWLKNICQALCPKMRHRCWQVWLIPQEKDSSFTKFQPSWCWTEFENSQIRNSRCEREALLDFVIFPPWVLWQNMRGRIHAYSSSALFWQLLYISELLIPHQQREAVCPWAKIKIWCTMLKEVQEMSYVL